MEKKRQIAAVLILLALIGVIAYRHSTGKDLEKYDQPIILLHDSNTMDNTAAVLGEIIDLIKEKGYSFGTLEERDEYTFPVSWRQG